MIVYPDAWKSKGLRLTGTFYSDKVKARGFLSLRFLRQLYAPEEFLSLEKVILKTFFSNHYRNGKI